MVQIELCRKINLPDQSPCQKENHLELCTDSNYVPPAVSRPQLTVLSNGHPPGLQAACRTTAQGLCPRASRSSWQVTDTERCPQQESAKYFSPLTRLQEVSQFRYALFYYYHIYIFILNFIYFIFFC